MSSETKQHNDNIMAGHRQFVVNRCRCCTTTATAHDRRRSGPRLRAAESWDVNTIHRRKPAFRRQYASTFVGAIRKERGGRCVAWARARHLQHGPVSALRRQPRSTSLIVDTCCGYPHRTAPVLHQWRAPPTYACTPCSFPSYLNLLWWESSIIERQWEQRCQQASDSVQQAYNGSAFRRKDETCDSEGEPWTALQQPYIIYNYSTKTDLYRNDNIAKTNFAIHWSHSAKNQSSRNILFSTYAKHKVYSRG